MTNKFFLRVTNAAIEVIFRWLSVHSSRFYTFHSRPKGYQDFKKASYPFEYSDLCVIIQGSIKDIKFVINTVRIYRDRVFPGAEIIVSTWVNEDEEHIGALKELGAKVIVSEKPENVGISNINLQILSTSRAVDVASKESIRYLMKTRTDQRVNAIDTYPYLLSLLHQFPSSDSICGGRLIALSLNTFKYRLYGISDMFMFGSVREMKKYWMPPLDQRISGFVSDESMTLREYSRLAICEVYLATKYLEKIGHNIAWTLEDSLDVYREFFCIIDACSIDLYWNKYTKKEFRSWDYSENLKFDEVSFRYWLSIYSLGKSNVIDESILDRY